VSLLRLVFATAFAACAARCARSTQGADVGEGGVDGDACGPEYIRGVVTTSVGRQEICAQLEGGIRIYVGAASRAMSAFAYAGPWSVGANADFTQRSYPMPFMNAGTQPVLPGITVPPSICPPGALGCEFHAQCDFITPANGAIGAVAFGSLASDCTFQSSDPAITATVNALEVRGTLVAVDAIEYVDASSSD
jgi:hypothetical protein